MLAKCKRYQAITHALNNSAYILLFGMLDLSHFHHLKRFPVDIFTSSSTKELVLSLVNFF